MKAVRASSLGSTCVIGVATVLSDSECLSTGSSTYAEYLSISCGGSVGLTLVNDTFEATGAGSRGGYFSAGGAGCSLTVTASNDIIRTAAGGTDVEAVANGTGANVAVNLDHSDYLTHQEVAPAGSTATVTDPGSATNITADPLLANPASGDIHETVGSPTIDAGATAPSDETTDLDGQPRSEGGKTDIGADEFVAVPAPVAGAPSRLTSTAVILTGTVNPGHDTTTPTIVYGTTPGLGSAAPALGALAPVLAPQPVSATLAGLAPGTKYYWRLSATNVAGSASTALQSFTTPAATRPPTPRVGAPKSSRTSLSGVSRGQANLHFRLSAGSNAPKLKSFRVKLPGGLSFVRNKNTLAEGVKLSVKGSEKISGGALVVTLKNPASSVKVTISSRALNERKSLIQKAKKRKVKALTVTIQATDTAHHTSTLKLTFKKPH